VHDSVPEAGRQSRQSGCAAWQQAVVVACQTDDDLPYVLKYAGEDAMIGSDYGHADNSELLALKRLKENESIPR
jgi:hypothetical protein